MTGVASVVPSVVATANLTLEQQKEMLMLQLKHEEMIKKAEIEKQLMVEKLRFETEQAKLNLQQYRLDLIKSDRVAEGFDVLGNQV